MYKKQIPTSYLACLLFLQAAASAHANDEATGRVLLRPDTAWSVQSLGHQYGSAHGMVARLKEERNHASRRVKESTDLLGLSLTDLYKATRIRINGGWLPRELLVHYGLPQKGRTPRATAREDWLPMAVATVDGHHAAQARGLETLDISEVEQHLADAQHAVAELKSVKNRLKDAEMERRTLRPQVTTLARTVSLELQSLLLSQATATRRDIMRSYGFEWRSANGAGAASDASTEDAITEDASTEDATNQNENTSGENSGDASN